MQKFVLFMIGLAVFVGIVSPSDERSASVASATQPAKTGLFEDAPYQETQLKRKPDGHFYVTAQVNGTPITFMVDTGASIVALTEADARTAGLEFSSGEFQPIARTASGIANGKNVTLRMVAIEGKEVPEVEGAIIQGGSMSLLGQSYLGRISGVQMNGDHMVLR